MKPRIRRVVFWIGVALLAVVTAVAAALSPRWLPAGRQLFTVSSSKPAEELHDDHEHGHSHDHAGHSEDTSIELSERGLKNIGFRPMTVELGAFTKTIPLPAIVIERPGRSQIEITSPLTGVITKIIPIRGAAIEPGGPMFQIRLTHEELVAAQRDLIRTAESLDVVNRELTRLRSAGEGVIAGKDILEQEYQKQKLEASLLAERQSLVLHGLHEDQVNDILRDKQLLQFITVRAPEHHDDGEGCQGDHLFHVQDLPVKLGQQVTAGQTLAVLADHCQLYVEGRAFEDDARRLRRAVREGWDVSAQLVTGKDEEPETVEGLKLMYLSDTVDPDSRAFHFYLSLPNEVALDQMASGHRFIEWRFKPGQRMELRVPVEKWEKRIVLPVEAIVDEGGESYVYQQNGDHFDRIPVHVEYRDQKSAVIANDGALFPGDVIAARGAYQMHLAVKNKAGGGVDPHAGHNH